MTELVYVQTDAEYDVAVKLFMEYAAWLDIDLSFQDFDKELSSLKKIYTEPFGGIILCRHNDLFIGCVALRKNQEKIAELKRMYVQPSAQQKGIGTLLLKEAIGFATKLGYKKIRLDTLDSMEPAMLLYKRNGFKNIPAYYYNPEKSAVYFEKDL
ncbi:MAG: GNAT family N-acetyltransferase [Ferruginibacter sp.]